MTVKLKNKLKMISPREQQVLEQVSFGLTTKEIASNLFLSDHTIISHKKNLLEKLNAANSPELVRKGFILGFLKLN